MSKIIGKNKLIRSVLFVYPSMWIEVHMTSILYHLTRFMSAYSWSTTYVINIQKSLHNTVFNFYNLIWSIASVWPSMWIHAHWHLPWGFPLIYNSFYRILKRQIFESPIGVKIIFHSISSITGDHFFSQPHDICHQAWMSILLLIQSTASGNTQN
jgi:hypothetical protein